MSSSSSKQSKMKGKNVSHISKVDFFDGKALHRILKMVGVVKPPDTSLPILRKAVLVTYSPKTLQLYCQFLSPGSYIEDEKKVDLINLILEKLESNKTHSNSIPTTPPPVKKTPQKSLPSTVTANHSPQILVLLLPNPPPSLLQLPRR